MGERKVLNKYFPPDFDPSLVPRRKRPKNEQIEVRMMLPFSIQCNTCGEYMYRGKKFNSRKEEVLEETYHGIRIYRFYIKCITCSSEITFKTDPKRGDYTAEHGCQRNFEPWRENEDEQEAALLKRQEEEKGDSMKALENRTLDSKREMDILDALDEIKAINQRHARIDTDSLLQQHAESGKLAKEEEQKQLEEDQLAAKRAFQKKRTLKEMTEGNNKQNFDSNPPPVKKANTTSDFTSVSIVKPEEKKNPAITVVVKKKVTSNGNTTSNLAKQKKKTPAKSVATSLVAEYSDSSDD